MYKFSSTLLFSLGLLVLCSAQNPAPGDWITMTLDMNDSMTIKNLGFEIKSKLESKILNIVSRNGTDCKISCIKKSNFDAEKIDIGDLSAGILCRPKLEVFEEEIIETGMEKLTAVKLNLSIFIQSVKGNVIFSSISKEYIGTGKNRELAVNNGIVSINLKDGDYTKFLVSSRREIVRYYDQMCGTILAQANQLVRVRRHVDAIFLLWPMPKEVKCYEEARDSLGSIYKDYVEFKCTNNIYNAKVYFSKNDFNNALNELYKIDAQTSCAKEALALMEKIAAKVDLKEQQQRELEKFKYLKENEIELEKERNRRMYHIVTGTTQESSNN